VEKVLDENFEKLNSLQIFIFN